MLVEILNILWFGPNWCKKKQRIGPFLPKNGWYFNWYHLFSKKWLKHVEPQDPTPFSSQKRMCCVFGCWSSAELGSCHRSWGFMGYLDVFGCPPGSEVCLWKARLPPTKSGGNAPWGQELFQRIKGWVPSFPVGWVIVESSNFGNVCRKWLELRMFLLPTNNVPFWSF